MLQGGVKPCIHLRFQGQLNVSAAIAAHAQDTHLAFIAGGTDLIGLMKDRVTLPGPSVGHQQVSPTWHRSKRYPTVGCA